MIRQHMVSRVRGHDSSVAQGQGQKGEFPDCEAGVISARPTGEERADLVLQTWSLTDNLTPARDASQRKGWQGLQEREEGGEGDMASVALLSQKRSPHSQSPAPCQTGLDTGSQAQVHRGLQDLPWASGHKLDLQSDETPKQRAVRER